MSEAPTETPQNPPDTGSPTTIENPNDNPNVQEPNVNPNPATPQNPSPAPTPETGGSNPDLLAEIRALPERFAHVLSERNPAPSAQSSQTQTQTQTKEPEGPNGKGDSWETRFARWWMGS